MSIRQSVQILFAALLPALAPVAFAQYGQQKNPVSEKVVAIRAVSLIDGLAAQPRHNVLVVIRGNKIESVSEGGTPPADATLINLPAGVTVLPG